MIAKRVLKNPKLPKEDSFKRLAKYITEKGHNIRITHCDTDDLGLALQVIHATQAMNTRTRLDKSYHLVISFRSDETPSLEQLRAIEDEVVAGIGYGDHQRISALHNDTDNLHLHIAINKIHPEHYRAIEPYYDYYKLDELCEKLELKYQLKRDNRIQDKRQERARVANSINSQSEGARNQEKFQGLESFERWVKQHINIQSLLVSKNWDELHNKLALYDCELRLRGAGMVIAHRQQALFVKASVLDRGFTKAKLETQFGSFIAPTEKIAKQPTYQSYQKRPFRGYQKDHTLYPAWQAQKTSYENKRKVGLAKIKQHQSEMIAAIKKDCLLKKKSLETIKDYKQRKLMQEALKSYRVNQLALVKTQASTDRKALYEHTKTPSWHEYLLEKANQGNDYALYILRQKPQNQPHEQDNTLTKGNGIHLNEANPIHHQWPKTIDQDGTVSYKLGHGNCLKDRGGYIELQGYQEKTLLAGLKMAHARYGQELTITGTPTFKADIARLAAEHLPEVRFKDYHTEQARKQALNWLKSRSPSQDQGLER